MGRVSQPKLREVGARSTKHEAHLPSSGRDWNQSQMVANYVSLILCPHVSLGLGGLKLGIGIFNYYFKT